MCATFTALYVKSVLVSYWPNVRTDCIDIPGMTYAVLSLSRTLAVSFFLNCILPVQWGHRRVCTPDLLWLRTEARWSQVQPLGIPSQSTCLHCSHLPPEIITFPVVHINRNSPMRTTLELMLTYLKGTGPGLVSPITPVLNCDFINKLMSIILSRSMPEIFVVIPSALKNIIVLFIIWESCMFLQCFWYYFMINCYKKGLLFIEKDLNVSKSCHNYNVTLILIFQCLNVHNF